MYFDKRFRVYLIDFNPFARVTDALLFQSLDAEDGVFAPLLRADRSAVAEGRASTQPGQERGILGTHMYSSVALLNPSI